MADRDLVLAKMAAIERCLDRIRLVTALDPQRLDDLDIRDIFVLNLQRAAQSAIDLAQHLVSAKALGLPSTLGEAFSLLERQAGLSVEVAARMRAMVGFRNLAVHQYEELDVAVLKAILCDRLDDLRRFCAYAAGQLA